MNRLRDTLKSSLNEGHHFKFIDCQVCDLYTVWPENVKDMVLGRQLPGIYSAETKDKGKEELQK